MSRDPRHPTPPTPRGPGVLTRLALLGLVLVTAWLTLANAAEGVGGNGLGFREVALLAVALVAEAALAVLVVIGG